jgi:predicted MFS family arabinose efflux permease
VWQSGRWWRCDGRVADEASIKALARVSCLHGHQLLYLHDVGNRSPHASVVVLVLWAFTVCLGPRASQSRTCRARRGLVVQGGDLLWRWRLVMRGGDLSWRSL